MSAIKVSGAGRSPSPTPTSATRAACPSAEAWNTARIAAGTTLADAARLMGVDERTLRAFTSGQVSRPSNLVSLALTKQYRAWLKASA